MSIFLCYVETSHLPSLLSHSLVISHNFPMDQNWKMFIFTSYSYTILRNSIRRSAPLRNSITVYTKIQFNFVQYHCTLYTILIYEESFTIINYNLWKEQFWTVTHVAQASHEQWKVHEFEVHMSTKFTLQNY